MNQLFIHEDKDWANIVRIVSDTRKIAPALVEKDYWIMHVLWSLSASGFSFFMKGGTSLSKGFKVIDRFSEDIDLLIEDTTLQSKTSQTDSSESNIRKRQTFFDSLVTKIRVPNAKSIDRDRAFDEADFRNAGIRVFYESLESVPGIKQGILLEVGFDDVRPYEELNISSWIIDHLEQIRQLENYFNNRALKVRCYCPEYTFIEKLQAISTKYRQLIEGEEPSNFARHYYDVHRLLQLERVQKFIGTTEYQIHKNKRFRLKDEKDLTKNEAFVLSDPSFRKQIEERYDRTRSLYYGETPSLKIIINDLK